MATARPVQAGAHSRQWSRVLLLATVAVLAGSFRPAAAAGQCPWPKNVTDLTAACTCSFVQSKLFVQCTAVNFTKLTSALRDIPEDSRHPIEQLHVANSSVPVLPDDSFYGLRVATLQLSNCGLRNVSAHAFRDLEQTLVNLNLPQNELTEECLPVLRKLKTLASLDLSTNRIRKVATDAFKGLALDTLNLMENGNLTLAEDAFGGLAASLKNLNLKGTGLTQLPRAVQNLTALAFLDLAHNALDDAEANFFVRLGALTALSLEQNQLRRLDPEAFSGLADTMTSLSLLNNQFETMPTLAVSSLKELRVLDLGFNKITEVPEDAFQNITSLTLLALDGNPLSTLPFKAFQHLRSTLRGLSVGGRSFVCDCHVRWIPEWVNDYNLQVTSRERNPPFCGHPPEQRTKNLYLLRPAQLVCPETTTTAATTTPAPTTTQPTPTTTKAKNVTTTITTTTGKRTDNKTTTTTTIKPAKTTTTTNDTVTGTSKSSRSEDSTSKATPTTTITTTPSSTTTTSSSTPSSTRQPSTSHRTVVATTLEFKADDSDQPGTTDVSPNTLPSLVRSSSSNQRTARKDTGKDIRIREAYRDDSTLTLTWEVTVPNVPGFRVVYRTFGDASFKEGALLSPREKRFRMKVPGGECLVVCVLSRADSRNLTAESTPTANCRELRGGGEHLAATSGHTEMDKIIIIAASAAICAAVVIAVIIFVCCSRRRQRGRDKMPPAHHLPPPIVSLPPLEQGKPEWDNASAYSSRSIPRARMYHMAGGSVNSAFLPDDVRSHISHMSGVQRGPSSLIDGQYGGYMSPHANHTNTLPNPYPLGRPDMNRSSKSLAMSYPPPPPPQQQHQNNKKKRSQQHQHSNGKWASMSTAGSVHSLTGYDTENGYFHPNPWAGNEVDHYSNGNHGPGSHISQPYNKRDYT